MLSFQCYGEVFVRQDRYFSNGPGWRCLGHAEPEV